MCYLHTRTSEEVLVQWTHETGATEKNEERKRKEAASKRVTVDR